jgi:hypothetical protein
VGGGAEAGPGKTPVVVGAVVGWLGFVGGWKSMPSWNGPLEAGLEFPDGDGMGGGGVDLLWDRGKWRRTTGNGRRFAAGLQEEQRRRRVGFCGLVLVVLRF